MSRIIERRWIFDKKAKEEFRSILKKYAEFCGIKILTYCIMSNHFHVLLYVPKRREITDQELILRMRYVYDKHEVDEFVRTLSDARKEALESGNEHYVNMLREKYIRRMYSLSEYMKHVKQSFSVWYNKRNKRKGTLWEERYKSSLVEGSQNALLHVAAYIDLNPVRAGIVEDPKDYQYCGYAEAVRGNKDARAGLGMVLQSLGQSSEWKEVSGKYRVQLYVCGERTETRAGFDPTKVREVIEADGKLSITELMRCRNRYMIDGLVFGSRAFVEKQFKKHKEQFGLKRKTGARAMKGAEWGDLCTMRDLRKAPISLEKG
jgi:REP element-mobilizing transposase RayT